jgi:hypothetical protein
MSYRFSVLAIALLGVLLSGCASMNSMESQMQASVNSTESSLEARLKAPAATDTAFVSGQQLTKRADLPFDQAWIKQGVDWRRFRTIYIAPVNTDYLMQANWWQQNLRADQMQQDVNLIATFMRTKFIRAFQNDPNQRFRVVMAPERGSLTLKLALTELVPSDVMLNAIKIAGPYGSGVAAAVLERATNAQSTVAFEAKVNDTNTGETVAMFADREYAVTRPIDLRGLTWYGNAEDIIATWSTQSVAIANRQPGEIVKPASTFSLMPW